MKILVGDDLVVRIKKSSLSDYLFSRIDLKHFVETRHLFTFLNLFLLFWILTSYQKNFINSF